MTETNRCEMKLYEKLILHLPKLKAAGSNPVSRSKKHHPQ